MPPSTARAVVELPSFLPHVQHEWVVRGALDCAVAPKTIPLLANDDDTCCIVCVLSYSIIRPPRWLLRNKNLITMICTTEATMMNEYRVA